MKYSVIIPVFNAEKTIEHCLDSLLSQRTEDVEYVVINDGSRDNSNEICTAYAEKYSCVKFFSKDNGGVSTARNLGLEKARGEFVLFVDSDDYVTDDYFKTIDSIISQKNPDMLVWGYKESISNITYSTGNFEEFSAEAVAKRVSPLLRQNAVSALWCRTFRRELIEEHRIRFSKGLNIAEDIAFILSYLLRTKSIVSIDKVLYNQCIDNSESLSRKRRDNLRHDLLVADKEMITALNTAEAEPRVCREYRAAVTWLFYRSVYSASKELLKYDLSRKDRRKKIKDICRLYCNERVKPTGWKCHVISLPVRMKLTFVIDYLIRR